MLGTHKTRRDNPYQPFSFDDLPYLQPEPRDRRAPPLVGVHALIVRQEFKMRTTGISFALLLWLLPSSDASCAERQDPYDEESQATYEERIKMLSDKAKATLAILDQVKFEKIEIRMDRPYETFEALRKQLGLHGVTVRLENYGEKQKPGEGAIPLVNIPIHVFMKYFDQAVGWGWIVYDDGSITYFDNVCSGNHPKDGVFYHKSQFDAGKPETMANKAEQDPANKKEDGESGPGE